MTGAPSIFTCLNLQIVAGSVIDHLRTYSTINPLKIIKPEALQAIKYRTRKHNMTNKLTGRPPKYDLINGPAEMQTDINRYFKRCNDGETVTVIRKGKPGQQGAT